MRNNKLLRAISYILIPILVGIILVACLYTMAKGNIYYVGVRFEDQYMRMLQSISRTLIYYDEKDAPNHIDNETKIWQTGNVYSSVNIDTYYYLIKYKNKAITNIPSYRVSSMTIEELKNFIHNVKGNKFDIVNGKITSDELDVNLDNYANDFIFSYYHTEVAKTDDNDTKISEVVNGTTSIEQFEIYSTYQKASKIDNQDYFINSVLNVISNYEDIMYVLVPISAVLIMILVVFLFISIGHTKGKDQIDTNDLDRIPLEILLLVGISAIFMILMVIMAFSNSNNYSKMFISTVITAYFVVYIIVAIILTTLIKRTKANILAETTIIGKIASLIQKLINKGKNVLSLFVSSMKSTRRLIFYTVMYLIIMLLVFAIFIEEKQLGVIADIGITIYVFYLIVKRANCFDRIEKQLKNIYEGNTEEKLDVESFTNEFKDTANYINDISNGFENAVEEGIKSERLKTELITNVSHDIKTPLTSIINYVDLIKQENIDNEKVKEYIEILEGKSHRLKRLTEDLVEASKASSGNVKLTLEKINVVELIKQTTGEFEDKFKQNNLEAIINAPEEEINIEADSRYMYRVIENLFSNISKYAASNTRIYIDVITDENIVKIWIKNISAQKLNISTDELMQRFVRGDKSRTTEGSGLGLSISKSLTELQNGKFEIQIDGDLFKVELEFERI